MSNNDYRDERFINTVLMNDSSQFIANSFDQEIKVMR